MSLTAVPDADDEHHGEGRFMAIRELPEAVARLQELKAEKADLEKEIAFCEVWIDEHVKESALVQIGEKQFRTTPVRGTVTTVDARKMARLLPEVAMRVTRSEVVTKVDTEALAREIELGNVPIAIMRQFVEQKPKKTSIRLTEHVPREEEEGDSDD